MHGIPAGRLSGDPRAAMMEAADGDWVVDPVAATELRLARIARLNPSLRAFIATDAAGARQQARDAAERRASGRPCSPIDGMPIGIKANIAVCGWPFHAGMAAYRHRLAAEDAACVARLRAGGAVLLGLLNMDEAALGDTTDNPHFGRTENPRHPGHTAGGSSGGAGAAIAAGLCEAALGTDTLGSVRIPAAWCGIIGHKPLPGEIPLDGVVPLCPDFDTIGILAKSVATVRAVRTWLGGEYRAAGLPGPVGIFPLDGTGIDAGTAAAFACTVEKVAALGGTLRPVPRLAHPLRDIARAALLIVTLDALVQHATERARNPGGFSKKFLDMLGWAEAQPVARRQAARSLLAAAGAEIRQAFAPFAVVLMPTTPCAAFAFDAPRPKDTAVFTTLANVAGLSATAFPDGSGSSVQAMGGNETACLELASRLAGTTESS